jgi:ATP-dependent Lon protease
VVPTPQGRLNSRRRLQIPEPSQFLPVLPLKDLSLFPGGSLTVVSRLPGTIAALQMSSRAGGRILAIALKEGSPRELHSVGTVAQIAEDLALPDGSHRVEVDGRERAQVLNLVGHDALIAEFTALEDGDAGDEWGAAVEALARYLHSHADLRAFLDGQRRGSEPMSWVNLACQHLPITASARQRLLESDALRRCQKISRGLDALLRREGQA